MSERLLKARDVAELLGVEMGTVLDYFEQHLIPGFRLGGRKGGPVRFRETEILAILEQWRPDGSPTLGALTTRAGDTRSVPARGPGGESSATRILRSVGRD